MRICIAIILCFCFLNFSAQETKFCQFIMTNVDQRAKAVEIDNFIRNKAGVTISRADVISKKYLILYKTNSNIDLTIILKWMDLLKVECKCIREGIHGVDKIIDLKIECDE